MERSIKGLFGFPLIGSSIGLVSIVGGGLEGGGGLVTGVKVAGVIPGQGEVLPFWRVCFQKNQVILT